MKIQTLFLATIALTSCGLAIGQTATPKVDKPVEIKVLINDIDRALRQNYVYPDKAQVMSSYLKKQLKKGAYQNIVDPQRLVEKIDGDLQAAHHDGHMSVMYQPPARSAGSPSGLRFGVLGPGSGNPMERLKQMQANNYSFKRVEVLDGNIGYLKFNGFFGPPDFPSIDEAKPVVTSAVRFLANTDALIIDLRDNGGGSPEMVRQICSYFFSERTRLNDIYNRKTDQLTESWADPERAENMKLSMPVYILTSRRTFSAAEDLAYAMQTNKRAITVGENTGGGAHPSAVVDVGQGFSVRIPYARSINYITKTDWEGTGVIADVPVPADNALQKAQSLIFEKRLADAQTDREKARVQWLSRASQAHGYDENVDVKTLRSFVGTYGRFNVTEKEDRLYLGVNNGGSFLLKPISANVFLVNDWLQVEFVNGADGKTALKFSGGPGSERGYRTFVGDQDVYERTSVSDP